MTHFRIGYLPLADAAPLIIAAELGFAEKHGVSLELRRETAWASLRDNLIVGNLDGAHMLAPMAIATSLGLGRPAFALHIPALISLNGNAITLSAALAEQLPSAETPLDARLQAMAALARSQAREGRRLTFATVSRFSSHSLLLAEAFRRGGGALASDIDLIVLAPSLMVEALRSGLIDGFCAGSPWNLAARDGVGAVILATGVSLIPDLAEKVLALSATVDGEAAARLVRALAEASAYIADPAHRDDVAAILAAPEHIGLPARMIRDSLRGDLGVDPPDPAYLKLDQREIAPLREAVLRSIVQRMADAGMLSVAQAAAINWPILLGPA